MRINNIAKNTSYFTLALILQKALSFAYFTILARNFVPDDLGKYYFAISFTAIFAIMIDLGFANVITREVAKAGERAGEIARAVIAMKIPLAILSLLSVVFLINLLHYPESTKLLVYFSAICMTLDSFTLAFYAVSRGRHNLKFESVGSVVYQVIVLLTGITVIKLNLGLAWLMAATISASLINFIFSWAVLKIKWGISPLPFTGGFKFDKVLTRALVAIAIPFALYGIFQRLYMYLDSVFLSILAGDYQVGIYQVPFKIVFALQFLPSAFMASLYPAFASYWRGEKNQLAISFERAMNYLTIIALPVSVGVITLADKIVKLFKTEYTDAILPLQLVMIALFFIFINFPIGALLNACDRQKRNTLNMGIVLVASIILNLWLIPKFQAVGASITVIITNILMFILGALVVPKIAPVSLSKLIWPFLKSIFAVACMALIVLTLKPYLNIFIVIALGGMVYVLLLFAMGGFSREDVKSVWRSFSHNS